MLTFVGILMVSIMMILLYKGKTVPVVTFVVLPIVAALITGFNITEIAEFINKGVSITWKTAVLFIFSVTYFGIMSDAGMFDEFIKPLLRIAGGNITAVFIVTAIISVLGHLDGSGATTFLIVIPAMLPIFKKLGLRIPSLMLVCCAWAGVMNMVPWGGSTLRAATVIQMDPTELWRLVIPVQIVGIIFSFALTIIIARLEKKRLGDTANLGVKFDLDYIDIPEVEALKRPKLLWFNVLLTFAIIVALLIVKEIPSFAVFMAGVAIALPVNYRTANDQQDRIKAHAPAAMQMAITLLSAGVLLGIMTHSGMIESIAMSFIAIFPGFLIKYLHIVVAVLTVPIHTVVATDPYYYALLPIVTEIVGAYGVSPRAAAIAMLIAENIAWPVSAVVPSVYLGIGLAGLEYREHLRFSFNWLWGLSILLVLTAVLFGLIVV